LDEGEDIGDPTVLETGPGATDDDRDDADGELPDDPAGGAGKADGVSPQDISETDEAEMLALTNEARADEGLPPLRVYWDLVDDARAQADAIMDAGALFHNPNLAGVTATTWTKLGENVGHGGSPVSLQAAFMASPAHRANLLGPDYDYVGIGALRDDADHLWIALVFMDSPIPGLHHGLPPFFDDEGSVHEAAIGKIFDAGITVGCAGPPHREFCPGKTLTRAEMAVFLDRALHLPATGTDFFGDDDGGWFEPAVNRLAASGITVGCGPGTYCPHDPVTRGQMAVFLDRALHLPPVAAGHDPFTDDDGRFYEASAERLFAAGITVGCGAGGTLFCGEDDLTRAEMASFLARALKL
jgi:hypothetical protein